MYLDIQGRPGEVLVGTSLDKSELTLLKVKQVDSGSTDIPHATVFATPKGFSNLRKKIEDFSEKNTKKRDGSEGAPRNADLVQSIGAIIEAGLRALWRSPESQFPTGQGQVAWEIWLDRQIAETFIGGASGHGVTVHSDRLQFPEDVVVLATATPEALATAVRRLVGVRALAAPTTTPDFFDGLPGDEQAGWVGNLLGRTIFTSQSSPNYVTLLDTGVSRAHPLIQPALAGSDRHAADPAWAIEDNHGHGTQLAGLALFGDLHVALQTGSPIAVSHKLESVKILPDVGVNPYHLYGAVTRNGVNAVETIGNRRRVFALATTTGEDNPHDGAPTSWSSEIDQLAAGVSGEQKIPRLFVVSAGNTDENIFTTPNYLSLCDAPISEIESPAHAWNAICVGAYTEKTTLPTGVAGTPVAPTGDLSPSSRTASWTSHWPIKPDVVFEGGNWLASGPPPPLRHQALSLLTTSREFPVRSFTTCGDTSGAAALAAKAVADIWGAYPELWPESIRALLIGSARWTPQMLSHLPTNPSKSDYENLFCRYGYGVPDLARARRSASNALTMIVQDEITPYRKSDKRHSPHVHNEMKVFSLPWPAAELRRLGAANVTLRIGLSTFIQPNPSEASRGSKFGYASHNLRFKLQRASESDTAFAARVSAAAQQTDGPATTEEDGWVYGRNRRDVGSIHVDQLTCPASDLARRATLAVYPVTGWWKTQNSTDPIALSARFSLILEIDAETVTADLYSEVATKIAAMTTVANPG